MIASNFTKLRNSEVKVCKIQSHTSAKCWPGCRPQRCR